MRVIRVSIRKRPQADAHDYCSIGCIEENSAARHYGYTGALNIALSTVLEMAMFGGKHRSDGIDSDSPNWAQGRQDYTSTPIWQMQSMNEFVAAFKFQMDEYAKVDRSMPQLHGPLYREASAGPAAVRSFYRPDE